MAVVFPVPWLYFRPQHQLKGLGDVSGYSPMLEDILVHEAWVTVTERRAQTQVLTSETELPPRDTGASK